MKTRLAADLGAEEARNIYRRLAERVWDSLAHPALARWLLVEPPAAVDRAAGWLAGAERYLGQSAGDLGERLRDAFDAAFDAGAPAVAAAGTDAPAVDAACVLRALACLERANAAVVPSHDGGYALLALRRPCPRLFQDIPWSTPGVLDSTRRRAASADLRWAELDAVRDLDTVQDLRELEAEGQWP